MNRKTLGVLVGIIVLVLLALGIWWQSSRGSQEVVGNKFKTEQNSPAPIRALTVDDYDSELARVKANYQQELQKLGATSPERLVKVQQWEDLVKNVINDLERLIVPAQAREAQLKRLVAANNYLRALSSKEAVLITKLQEEFEQLLNK